MDSRREALERLEAQLLTPSTDSVGRTAALPSKWPSNAILSIDEDEKRRPTDTFFSIISWLGRQDSNLRMLVPKTSALPLGDAPIA